LFDFDFTNCIPYNKASIEKKKASNSSLLLMFATTSVCVGCAAKSNAILRGRKSEYLGSMVSKKINTT
jgi:hypothetical protein